MCKSVTIRSKISEKRREKNLKQAELAVTLGIDPSQLRRIEGIGRSESENTNRYISVEILDKLCLLLDCQPGDLFVYESEEK